MSSTSALSNFPSPTSTSALSSSLSSTASPSDSPTSISSPTSTGSPSGLATSAPSLYISSSSAINTQWIFQLIIGGLESEAPTIPLRIAGMFIQPASINITNITWSNNQFVVVGYTNSSLIATNNALSVQRSPETPVNGPAIAIGMVLLVVVLVVAGGAFYMYKQRYHITHTNTKFKEVIVQNPLERAKKDRRIKFEPIPMFETKVSPETKDPPSSVNKIEMTNNELFRKVVPDVPKEKPVEIITPVEAPPKISVLNMYSPLKRPLPPPPPPSSSVLIRRPSLKGTQGRVAFTPLRASTDNGGKVINGVNISMFQRNHSLPVIKPSISSGDIRAPV